MVRKAKMYTAVLTQLLKRDFMAYKREFWGKFFDVSFLLFTNLIVFGYFMSKQGLGANYGPFILVGAIATFGFFDTVGKVSMMIADIEGDRTISYTLTMPLPSWLVFVYTGVYWALNSALLSLPLFFIGKLILFDQFNLSAASWWRVALIYMVINLFYGFFSLWLTSMIKNMGGLNHLFVRFINPMFMFGAYFYTWATVYQFSSLIGWVSLINPMVYAMEGLRAATLGQSGYLPYWVSLLALLFFTCACGWHATRRLSKRLDCV